MIVTLPPTDQLTARAIARLRNDPKVGGGVPTKKIRPDTDLAVHVDGVAAEIAVAHYYGVLPDTNASMHGDAGYDLVINGLRCEVKLRHKPWFSFALMSPDPDSFNAEVGILVYKAGEWRYDIAGIISAQRLRRVGHVEDYGYGPRWVVERKHFSDPSLIWLHQGGHHGRK